MKIIERMVDYIKSCIYYPKMKKYFDERNMAECNCWRNKRFAVFRYAWWHYHVGKLKNK